MILKVNSLCLAIIKCKFGKTVALDTIKKHDFEVNSNLSGYEMHAFRVVLLQQYKEKLAFQTITINCDMHALEPFDFCHVGSLF